MNIKIESVQTICEIGWLASGAVVGAGTVSYQNHIYASRWECVIISQDWSAVLSLGRAVISEDLVVK